MHKPIRFRESFNVADQFDGNFRITRTHNEDCWRSHTNSEWHQAITLKDKAVALAAADLIRNHPCQRFAVWYRWRIILLYDPRSGIRTRNHTRDDDGNCWATQLLDCECAIKKELAKYHRRLTRHTSRVKCNHSALRPLLHRKWRIEKVPQTPPINPLLVIGEKLWLWGDNAYDESDALACDWDAMEADPVCLARYFWLRGEQEILDVIDNPLHAEDGELLALPETGIPYMYQELCTALGTALRFDFLFKQPDQVASLYFRGPTRGVPFHRGMVERVCEAYTTFDANVRKSTFRELAPEIDQRNSETGLLICRAWAAYLRDTLNSLTDMDNLALARRQAHVLTLEALMLYGLDGQAETEFNVTATLSIRFDAYLNWLDELTRSTKTAEDLCLPTKRALEMHRRTVFVFHAIASQLSLIAALPAHEAREELGRIWPGWTSENL